MTRRQLDLFGAEDLGDAHGLAPLSELAPPPPELVALAARVPAHVRFGTSSWTFPGWRGLVYHRDYRNDRQFVRYSLGEYARHPLMRTVGIDRSFYAPIDDRELHHYAGQLPPGFRCVMKLWAELSTMYFPRGARFGDRAGKRNPGFLDPVVFRDTVAEPVLAEFADHIGPIVIEIPAPPGVPDTVGFTDTLDRFLAAAPPALQFAVELRDRRMLTRRYLDVLRAHGATHVFNFWSRMPPLAEQLAIRGSMPGPFVVVRLLIPPGRSYTQLRDAYEPFDRIVEPAPAMRADVVELIRRAGDRGWPIFVIANNKAEGSSPRTIHALAELVAGPGES